MKSVEGRIAVDYNIRRRKHTSEKNRRMMQNKLEIMWEHLTTYVVKKKIKTTPKTWYSHEIRELIRFKKTL